MKRSLIISFFSLNILGCSTTGPATIERNENMHYRYDATLQMDTIGSGESLSMIANKYGTSVDEIARINSLPANFIARSNTDVLVPIRKETSSSQGISSQGNKSQEIYYGSSAGSSLNTKDKNLVDNSEYISNKQYYSNEVQVEPITLDDNLHTENTSNMYLENQSTQQEKIYEKRTDSNFKSELKQSNAKAVNNLQDSSEKGGKFNTIHDNKTAKNIHNEMDTNKEKNNKKSNTKDIPDKLNINQIDIKSLDKIQKKDGDDNLKEIDDNNINIQEKSIDKKLQESSQQKKLEQSQIIEANTSFKLPNPLGLSNFMWPLHGKILQHFDKNSGSEGMNIAASANTIVRAAADGKVIYVGNSVNQYGNLLIIRHEGDYLSAYAHNSQIIVKKDQQVRKGQAISKVGQSGGVSESQLYFSIRHDKKVIDPEAKQ